MGSPPARRFLLSLPLFHTGLVMGSGPIAVHDAKDRLVAFRFDDEGIVSHVL